MNNSSNPKKHYASAIYDVAVDTGAVATLVPKETSVVPDNAIIVELVIETLAVGVGNSHTLIVNAGGVAISAATSIANRSVTVPYTTVTPKKATSAAAISVTIGTGIATAGKYCITVGYFTSGE